jgi:hypothetical protein
MASTRQLAHDIAADREKGGMDAWEGADWEQAYMRVRELTASEATEPAKPTATMRNEYMVGLYSQWFMLVGGKQLFERAVGGESSVTNKRLPYVHPSGTL